jgi:hypothetical protein
MKRKMAISLSIFILLLVGAWFIHTQTKRDHILFEIRETEPVVEQIVTPEKVEAEEVKSEQIWNFRPREYIKIRERNR